LQKALYSVTVNQDILDRALREPVASPHALGEDVTAGDQVREPLPRVTSSCESMATAVGVAERALSQSAQLLSDLDSYLSTTNDAHEYSVSNTAS